MKKRIAAKKKANKALAQRELAGKNLGIAAIIARRRWNKQGWLFERLGMKFSDVKQEAVVAMQMAAKYYEPSRGKFGAYAGKAVNNYLSLVAKSAGTQKRGKDPVSLNTGNTGKDFEENAFLLEDKRPPAIRLEIRGKILKIVENLPDAPEKRKAIFIRRFGLRGGEPKECRELAKEFGVSSKVIRYAIERVSMQLRFHPEMKQFSDLL